MLNLKRRPGEKIVIAGNIVITLIDVRGRDGGNPRVRIGFEAPRDVPIHRQELLPLSPKPTEDAGRG